METQMCYNHGMSFRLFMECFCSVFLSVIAVSGSRIDLTDEGYISGNGNFFICALMFLFFAAVLLHSFRTNDRRIKFYSSMYAVITAVFYVVGANFDKMKTLLWLKRNSEQAVLLGHTFFYHAVLNYCVVFLVFQFAIRFGKHVKIRERQGVLSRNVLLYWGILFLCFLPWFLYLYPGYMTQDSEDMLQQAIGQKPLSDHHSVLLTICMRCIIMAVRHLTGSYLAGTAVFLFIQMLLSAFIFALCLELISRCVPHKSVMLLFLLWFLFYPVYPIYSVTLWKDIPFSICFMILMLIIVEIIRSPQGFFNSAKSGSVLFFSMLLLPIFRHNGIAVSLIVFVSLLLQYKAYRKKIVSLCGSALILAGVWNMLLLPAFHVEKVETGLSLSVMQQQIARTLSRHHESIPREEREALQAYFDIPVIWERYNPVLSDSVKKHFVEEKFEEDPLLFFKLWAKLGLRYPLDYIEAFLHNNFGYWYPDAGEHLHFTGTYIVSVDDIHPSPLIRSELLGRICSLFLDLEYYQMPGISLLFSRGACFWGWLLCGVYCLYRNRQKFILFVPGLILWLTVLISPVYNEYRYVYGLFAGLPLLLAVSFVPYKDEHGIRPEPAEIER